MNSNPNDRKSPLLPALLLAAFFVTACEAPPPPPPPPVENLVLICIDTVGSDAFFSERIDDALARRMSSSQQYVNANSVAPWTIPSVASTLTGLYPVQHNAGQFENEVANLAVDLPNALADSAETLAEILNENQFRTGAVSAHPWFTAGFGLEQGFKQLHARRGWEKVTEKFKTWLDQPKKRKQPAEQQRFFGYLHFMEAHDWHLESQAKLDERLASIDPGLRSQLLEDTNDEACMDEASYICHRNLVYNLAVRELRNAIDSVLQGLEERNLLESTLVIVYSDHGEEFWQHKEEHQQHSDPRGIYGFGHGQSLYQELLHVPLLAWHPGIKGAVRQDLVSLIDVVPSALNWLGIDQSDRPLPGINLPAGTDPMSADEDSRIIYASGIAYGPEAIAAREGQLKSILRYPEENFEYFDLTKDPGEKHPVKSDRLTMQFDVLTGDYVDMKSESLAFRPELDAKTLEHLKSIGYLQGVEEKPKSEAEKAPAKKPTPDDGPNNPDPEDPPE
jgi:arylsulfatase A-like enzyme